LTEVSINKSWAHSVLADFYARHNQLDKSLIYYQLALKTNRETGGLWISLAQVYEQLGKFSEAREAFQKAVEYEPVNFYANYAYGNFLFNQGELQNAIEYWEAARQINPRSCRILLNIGLAFESLGDKEQAKNYYVSCGSDELEPDQDCQTEAAKQLSQLAP